MLLPGVTRQHVCAVRESYLCRDRAVDCAHAHQLHTIVHAAPE